MANNSIFQFGVDSSPDWFWDRITDNRIITHSEGCCIHTPERILHVDRGEYITLCADGSIAATRIKRDREESFIASQISTTPV